MHNRAEAESRVPVTGVRGFFSEHMPDATGNHIDSAAKNFSVRTNQGGKSMGEKTRTRTGVTKAGTKYSVSRIAEGTGKRSVVQASKGNRSLTRTTLSGAGPRDRKQTTVKTGKIGGADYSVVKNKNFSNTTVTKGGAQTQRMKMPGMAPKTTRVGSPKKR